MGSAPGKQGRKPQAFDCQGSAVSLRMWEPSSRKICMRKPMSDPI